MYCINKNTFKLINHISLCNNQLTDIKETWGNSRTSPSHMIKGRSRLTSYSIVWTSYNHFWGQNGQNLSTLHSFRKQHKCLFSCPSILSLFMEGWILLLVWDRGLSFLRQSNLSSSLAALQKKDHLFWTNGCHNHYQWLPLPTIPMRPFFLTLLDNRIINKYLPYK